MSVFTRFTWLSTTPELHCRLAFIGADGGYTGSLVAYCLAALALVLAIVNAATTRRGSWCCPSSGSSSGSSST
ncbi:hypothetical protein [Streptomyces mirabilis]|uniref:hypothetical protein n=1 Tax=Streptomyces mirabilis TaxID=68239 RepID=UPI0036AEC177